ncbi:MAG: SpoIID/LytB domain-containing protein [Hyphomicrobiales bacterium]
MGGASKLLVSASKDCALRVQGGGAVADARAGSALEIVRMGPGSVEVYRKGTMAPVWSGGPGDTLLLDPGEHGFVGYSNSWYRGTFRIFATQPEGLTLVNEVDLEGYLRGVLPHEIGKPPDTDYEAVKAQAVAARSYTLSYLGRRAALGFDLWATVEDQVYGGTRRENPQSDRALRETRGEILICEGVPIRALYSSVCGGRTANVEDVWPWPWTPYLRSVRDADGNGDDPYCSIASNFRWREEWGTDAFMAMLRKYGPQEGGAASVFAGDLLDVRIGARARCGRVSDLIVTTTTGDFRIGGDRTRWALRRPGGDAILRSDFFKIGIVRRQDGSPFMVVASGAGNGHGIGMCQWGAMGMARAGKGYREILRHYYKATQLAHL